MGESYKLEVKAEEFMVLLVLGYISTLLLATQVLGKLDLLINFRFASAPDRRLGLPLEVKPSEAWVLGGGGGFRR